MAARLFPVSSQFTKSAAFRLRLWLCARLLPFRIAQSGSLEAMLALAEPASEKTPLAGVSSPAIVRAVRRTLRRPLLMRDRPCLREGLLAYRFLAEAGYRPRLHFGVDPGIVASTRTMAHCWVTLDGATVIGETQTRFVEVLSLPRGDFEVSLTE